MTRLTKCEVTTKIAEIGLLPTFYEGNVETAKKIVAACAEGGAKVVEFTNRGALAYQVFSELIKWRDKEFPDVILGIGTIIEPLAASLFINCGANFVVGPMFNPEVAKTCNRYKVVYVPGCSTPSEISRAEEMGADIIKIFPADVLGPQFIKDILGPCPWSRLMPSGGVEATKESISSWIRAGAVAVNMGSNLIVKDFVKVGDFEAIKNRVEKCIRWVHEARGTPLFLGVEHLAIYPTEKADANAIADWYAETFGFTKKEGQTSIMLSGVGVGKIEVMKAPEKGVQGHVGIYVSNFEAACNYLKEKSVKLEEPVVKAGVKAVYLKDRDPVGNRVHLIYRS